MFIYVNACSVVNIFATNSYEEILISIGSNQNILRM